MRSIRKPLKLAATVAMTGALASGAMLASTAPAMAAPSTAGQFTLCSDGSYYAEVKFINRGGWTVGVASGCHTYSGLGSSTAVEQIEVFGVESPSTFWITNGNFRPSHGGTVVTYGSPAHPWASTPQV